ncbi:MAG: leucine-rich repeat domain-containing protein, partial [Synergistaceae bacterium]|nr:leucine-rich repeat domain-containing protein [Synergistaceae bacterium]
MRRFVSCLAVTLAILSVSFVWRSEELPSYAKLLTGMGVIPANADVAITEANFPDETFREYVSSNFDTDEDGELSDEEIEAATIIDVAGTYNSRGNISSLNGIEYFTALRVLQCEYNQLTTLNVSNNTVLTGLYCNGNQLTALDVSNNIALTHLDCCYNHQLTKLDVSKNTALMVLRCSDNQLTA